MVLLVRRGRNRVDARRVRERLQLRRDRRGGDLRHHEARVHAALARQERRQAAARRIDQPIRAPLADRRQRHDRRGEQIRGDRNRRAVEIPARDDVAGLGEHHRVVGGAVGLDRRCLADEAQRVARRALHLRSAAQRVGVLHLAAELVRLVDAAAAQQPLDVRGRRLLAGEGARVVDARLERMDRAAQRVDRQRRRDVGGARELLGRRERERQHSRRRLRPVDEREALLRSERDRCQPGTGERLRTGKRILIVVLDLALSDEHEREVRERREIPARADRAARGDARVHAGVHERDERVQRLEADAREAFCQRVGAQCHRGADRARRQRIADAGRMAAQQVELERLERVGRDLHVGKRSEAGVDAVGRLVAARAPIHDLARRAHARARLGRERDGLAAIGDRDELFDGERGAVENNHR